MLKYLNSKKPPRALAVRTTMNGKYLIKVFVILVIMVHAAMLSVFIFHETFNFTSSNSALYMLKGKKGGIELSRDLLFEDADRLIFMLDANSVFEYFMKGLAVAKGKSVLELTWNRKKGMGDIKQFRKNGEVLAISFSRYREDAADLQGLFLGGDLPYGESKFNSQKTSGFGFFDGENWSHIWCAANEGLKIMGSEESMVPPLWTYNGSRVLKNTRDEIILESDHEAVIADSKLRMKRFAYVRAGDDYFILKVRITNASKTPISYGYAYGDEPWVGEFGSSDGDVGWHKGGLVKHERFVSPIEHSYAGYWDYGNDAAHEGQAYTGKANFIQWLTPMPSYVFFSNDFDYCCNETKPLNGKYSRVINIVWLNQMLMPGKSRDHILAIGMARVNPETGFPEKPAVALN